MHRRQFLAATGITLIPLRTAAAAPAADTVLASFHAELRRLIAQTTDSRVIRGDIVAHYAVVLRLMASYMAVTYDAQLGQVLRRANLDDLVDQLERNPNAPLRLDLQRLVLALRSGELTLSAVLHAHGPALDQVISRHLVRTTPDGAVLRPIQGAQGSCDMWKNIVGTMRVAADTTCATVLLQPEIMGPMCALLQTVVELDVFSAYMSGCGWL